MSEENYFIKTILEKFGFDDSEIEIVDHFEGTPNEEIWELKMGGDRYFIYDCFHVSNVAEAKENIEREVHGYRLTPHKKRPHVAPGKDNYFLFEAS